MIRLAFFPIAVALAVLILLFLATDDAGTSQAPIATGTFTVVESRYQGKTVKWWAARAVQARKDANARGRTIRRLRHELAARYQPSSVRAIALASTTYRVSFHALYRKARCETGGTLSPYAKKNPSSTASGLFQFLTSTWASTPYGRFSIWDPYANALAAAWMHRAGRGGEWACQ